MYEMAAGRMAFAGETAIDTLVVILEKEPPPLDQYAPGVPAEFQRIIAKAVRKDKEERYQTIKDLRNDLKSLQEELAFVQKLERSTPPHTNDGTSTAHVAGNAVTDLKSAHCSAQVGSEKCISLSVQGRRAAKTVKNLRKSRIWQFYARFGFLV
jgi:serine/threonine protein kinase